MDSTSLRELTNSQYVATIEGRRSKGDSLWDVNDVRGQAIPRHFVRFRKEGYADRVDFLLQAVSCGGSFVRYFYVIFRCCFREDLVPRLCFLYCVSCVEGARHYINQRIGYGVSVGINGDAIDYISFFWCDNACCQLAYHVDRVAYGLFNLLSDHYCFVLAYRMEIYGHVVQVR